MSTRNEAFSARVIVEAKTPAGVKWAAALELLRSYDLPKEGRDLTTDRAAQILGEKASSNVLDRLRSLQRSVWLIDQEPSAQPAIVQHGKSRYSVAEIEKRILKYLKTAGAGRVNIPKREPGRNGEYLSELFRALSGVTGEREFAAVMQNIAPGIRLPPLRQSRKTPDEVLHGVLTTAAISARLALDKDGVLAVLVTPLDRVAALLLRTLEVEARSTSMWAKCESCKEFYRRARCDQRGCSTRCKNNLRVREYRARKAARKKAKQRRQPS